MTEDELATLRRRRGYWLRLAREHANMDQNSVARELGLSPKSGTTILAWEKGQRSPSADQLHQLARIFKVPVSWFSEPRPTDLEELERAQELAAAALAAEAEDWASAADRQDRAAEGAEDDQPGRRSA